MRFRFLFCTMVAVTATTVAAESVAGRTGSARESGVRRGSVQAGSAESVSAQSSPQGSSSQIGSSQSSTAQASTSQSGIAQSGATQPVLTSGDWTRVAATPQGTRLHVDFRLPDDDLALRVTGIATWIDRDGLVVRDGERLERISRPQVRSVTVIDPTQRDSLGNGAVIGAAAGAAYGLWGAIALSSSDEITPASAVLIPLQTAAMGAGVGVLVDWLFKRPRQTRIYP